jgi:hypothetical protein
MALQICNAANSQVVQKPSAIAAASIGKQYPHTKAIIPRCVAINSKLAAAA